MNVEQADAASFRIVTLIEGGATPEQVVSEAQQYVRAWRRASDRPDAQQDLNKAVGVFQTNMQATVDELRKQIPKPRFVERRGVRVTLPGENTTDVRIKHDPAFDRVREQIIAFLSVAEALASEGTPEADG